jgi:hypothetical protein
MTDSPREPLDGARAQGVAGTGPPGGAATGGAGTSSGSSGTSGRGTGTEPPPFIVQRWKRHGHDRAYVKVDNVQVGYRDVITTEVHCHDETHRATIEAATEHLVRHRGSRLTVPGAGGSPVVEAVAATAAASANANANANASTTAGAASAPPATTGAGDHPDAPTGPEAGGPHYLARHIDPRYAPHPGAAEKSDPASEDAPRTGWRRWLQRH